ncbi:purine nucleosidase [Kaistia hirudinis]|uniref:Purine nucleosidase n=1 Tax=Kaistia hirudinis TaxID=1293440 RepID=A0A840ARG9_9HYPH|nr:nucleoside hydrolase [Kaistia hirudinis]MBB3931441.1 purine nucleosidase [Kaistia hirudinis]
MTEKRRIILDVDTGVDDAMAILYAINRPGLTLEACTTVFGNTEIENATRNTLQILELGGRADIPVAAGAARSLLHPFIKTAGHVHGDNGLGEITLPPPRSKPLEEHASDLIIRLARENPGEITLVPVGPLTNVALAIAKDRAIAGLLREIVVMGSTVFHPGIGGTPRPMVDANFLNDPEAAHIVINSGARITLVGMDVTMRTMLTADRIAQITAEGGPAGRKLMEITKFYLDFYNESAGYEIGAGMHDPLAVAIAEDPSLVTKTPMLATVELNGEWTRGQFIADRRRQAEGRENVDVCTDVQVDRFIDRFVETIKTVGL